MVKQNVIFKKNEIIKARVFYFILALCLIYLLSNFLSSSITDLSYLINNGFISLDKDTLLSYLVNLVIEHQFNFANEFLKDKTQDKLYKYAFESVLQLYIAESKEHIREMYAVSYSMPSTTHKIYDFITLKLEETFKEYLPECNTKEFYEFEMASAGIMRGYIINPCTMYFTMDRKVERFLQTSLRIYKVPEDKIINVINFVKKFDMEKLAQKVLDTLYEYIINRT